MFYQNVSLIGLFFEVSNDMLINVKVEVEGEKEMRSISLRKNRYKILIFIFIYFFVTQAPNSYAQNTKKKDVLILNSYHDGLEWSDNIVKEIKGVFETSRYDINLYIEYMDTRNNADSIYLNKLYDLYKHKFKNRKFDVIIASDDPAYNFLLKYQNQIVYNTPAVFCGVNEFQESQLNNRPLVTGVVETVDIF